MDRYDSFSDYSNAKNKIYSHAQLCIYNQEDFQTKPLISHDNLVSFGLIGECFEKACWHFDPVNRVLRKGQQQLASLDDFSVSGDHNGLNALVVLAMAEALGVDINAHMSAFSRFSGLPHRCELVGEYRNVRFIDDSKATNVNATYFALESMDAPTVWIVGGVDKGNDYEELAGLVDSKVKAIVALGLDNSKIIESFQGKCEVVDTDSMKDAVKAASKLASKGDVVLLSPCCASFDLFKSYEDRGEQFKNAVRML